MSCEACKAKDQMIEFLAAQNKMLLEQQLGIVDKIIHPYSAPTAQTFAPTYVDEFGKVIHMGEEPKTETEIGAIIIDENGEEKKVAQEVDVENEILGH